MAVVRAAIATLRDVFRYLPANPWERSPIETCGDPPDRRDPELRGVVPDRPNRAFDIMDVLRRVVDRGSLFELSPEYGRSLITALARMDGHTVAVMANQSMHMGGVIDVAAAIKASRLLGLCDFFGLPVVCFLDTPGVITTKDQKHRRLMRHVFDWAIARLKRPVPKVSVVVRKAYGYALFGMGAGDPEGYTFAWPTAQIAFMGPEPALRVAFAPPDRGRRRSPCVPGGDGRAAAP